MFVPLATPRTLIVLLGLSAAACTIRTPASVARARAANDFQCPEEQVIVESKEGNTVAAAGCGKTANYTCDMPQGGGITCVSPGVPATVAPLPPPGAAAVPPPAPAVIKN